MSHLYNNLNCIIDYKDISFKLIFESDTDLNNVYLYDSSNNTFNKIDNKRNSIKELKSFSYSKIKLTMNEILKTFKKDSYIWKLFYAISIDCNDSEKNINYFLNRIDYKKINTVLSYIINDINIFIPDAKYRIVNENEYFKNMKFKTSYLNYNEIDPLVLKYFKEKDFINGRIKSFYRFAVPQCLENNSYTSYLNQTDIFVNLITSDKKPELTENTIKELDELLNYSEYLFNLKDYKEIDNIIKNNITINTSSPFINISNEIFIKYYLLNFLYYYYLLKDFKDDLDKDIINISKNIINIKEYFNFTYKELFDYIFHSMDESIDLSPIPERYRGRDIVFEKYSDFKDFLSKMNRNYVGYSYYDDKSKFESEYYIFLDKINSIINIKDYIFKETIDLDKIKKESYIKMISLSKIERDLYQDKEYIRRYIEIFKLDKFNYNDEENNLKIFIDIDRIYDRYYEVIFNKYNSNLIKKNLDLLNIVPLTIEKDGISIASIYLNYKNYILPSTAKKTVSFNCLLHADILNMELIINLIDKYLKYIEDMSKNILSAKYIRTNLLTFTEKTLNTDIDIPYYKTYYGTYYGNGIVPFIKDNNFCLYMK